MKKKQRIQSRVISYLIVSGILLALTGCGTSSKKGEGEEAGGFGKHKLYPYNTLVLKDLDQMSRLVKEKIRESRASGEKIIPLREGMQAVYSRPNEDFMIEKVVAPLKNELDDHEGWESTMRSLVDEAISALKNPDSFRPQAQVTYSILLENVMAELKPDADKPFERGIFTAIRGADIELSRQAVSERELRIMKKVKSPSEIASLILADVEKREKERSKNQAKEEEPSDVRSRKSVKRTADKP